ncbi:GNAT family N-acetyltransferase, partial [Streptomyces sp. SID7499]|nr:GNAT family N-acetyltransferase [Streptomyces sp. SID7499]
MGQTLAEILDGAACGRFPETDGGTTVVAAPNGRDTGVIA